MKRKAMLRALLICALGGVIIWAQNARAEDEGAPTESVQISEANYSGLQESAYGCESGPPFTACEALLQWLDQWWNGTGGDVQSGLDNLGGRQRPPVTDGGEEGFDFLIRQ